MVICWDEEGPDKAYFLQSFLIETHSCRMPHLGLSPAIASTRDAVYCTSRRLHPAISVHALIYCHGSFPCVQLVTNLRMFRGQALPLSHHQSQKQGQENDSSRARSGIRGEALRHDSLDSSIHDHSCRGARSPAQARITDTVESRRILAYASQLLSQEVIVRSAISALLHKYKKTSQS